MIVSTAVISPTIATARQCPKCGTFSKSGRVSCCAPGGAWYKKCGGVGDSNVGHSWLEGTKACKRKCETGTMWIWFCSVMVVLFCCFCMHYTNTNNHMQQSRRPLSLPYAPNAASPRNPAHSVVAVAAALGLETVGVSATPTLATRGTRACRPAKHRHSLRQSSARS